MDANEDYWRLRSSFFSFFASFFSLGVLAEDFLFSFLVSLDLLTVIAPWSIAHLHTLPAGSQIINGVGGVGENWSTGSLNAGQAGRPCPRRIAGRITSRRVGTPALAVPFARHNRAMTQPTRWPRALSGNYLLGFYPDASWLPKPAMFENLTRDSVVSLREITRDTLRTVACLDVGPGQEGLVAPNAYSIAQAHFHPEAWFRAIYADEVPVGFAMLEDWSQVPDREPELYEGAPYVALWRYMIDHRAQRRGFGAQAIALLIAHARTRPGVGIMLLSFVPKDNNPEPFYRRFGFVPTGEIDEGEVVMKLAL
jgi:diamine N-acetyltransferase